jgi:hypothetical protein
MLLRSTALGALLLVPLLPLAGQDEQGNVSAVQAGVTAAPEYSGPAVLSRANQPVIGQFAFASIQPFFSVNQFYETGPNAALSGGTPNGSMGLALALGLTGTHHWKLYGKNVILSVHAEGEYQRYSRQSTILSTNQLLDLTAVVPLQHHLTISFRETAGTTRQDFGTLLLQPQFQATSTPVPSNEPFNTPVKFVNSMCTIVYHKSPRLSFSASVDESLMRGSFGAGVDESLLQGQSSSLVGTNSTAVKGDVNYQLTPRTTVGLDYAFDHYGYTTFGSGDFNVASLDYSWRVTRTVEVAVQVGAAHGTVRSLSLVPIDPQIAALLGVTAAVSLSDQVVNTPSYSARLMKSWRHASADLDYQKSVSPGNGLVLASTIETATGGFRYTVRNGWALSLQGGWAALSALSSTTSKYSSYTANVIISHAIRPGLQTVATFGARPFTYVGPAAPNRTYYIAQIGLMFSPRPLPIVLR